MSPSIKLIFATNTLPRFKDRSHGVWRRLIVMPFNVAVPQDQQDPELSQKLEAELPGILNWATKGLQRLLSQNRFTDCAVCRSAKNEHQFDCDPIKQFVDECIEFRAGMEMPKEAAFELYRKWCDDSNHRPMNSQNFKKQFSKVEGVGLERGGVTTLRNNDLGQSEKTGAAECAALGVISNNDADLATLLQAWPGLSLEARAEVMAIVAAARGQV